MQDMDWRVKWNHCSPRLSTANESLSHIYACVQEEWNSWRSSYTCRIPSRRASRARWGQGSVAVFTTESWSEVITAATAPSVTVPQLHPGMCNSSSVQWKTIFLLQHDNARPRTSLKTVEHIGWTVVPHPQYSPELAPSDFHLFGPMKDGLRGQHFPRYDAVVRTVKQWATSACADIYERGLQALAHRWQKCVNNCGD